ncbi:MAG: type II secretion system F family protein [Blautia sp.]|nr:type II secretion system F family protein [Blautia sp.]
MINKLSNQELFHFCEQLSIILHSGLPAVEGLRLLMEDSPSKDGRDFLESLLNEMEMTGSLADTLEQSQAFPEAMISYIQLGERTGCLDEVMDILAKYYAQEIESSEQIRNAITYPLIMLGMMAVVIVILLIRVLPVFAQVFRQMGLEMTGFSAGLMGIGSVLERYSFVFLILLAALIGLTVFLILHPKGRALLSRTVQRLPFFREIPTSLDFSRLAQGISMGLRSGLDPEESMEMAAKLISTPSIIEHLEKAVTLLREGESFSNSLTASELFTGMEARLISIGFASGSGDDVMQKLSARYQEDSIARVQDAISVLEPTIVIIMSLLVGLVLLSVMLPLLGILSELMA